MNDEQARTHCHAYLDGQLSAATRAEIEALLANDTVLAAHFEEQREFLAMLKKRSQSMPPPSLDAGIRARLSAAVSTTSFQARETSPFRRRWMVGVAAGLALTLGAAGLYWSMHEECPYMVACIAEHRQILEGGGDYARKETNTQRLAGWVSGEVKSPLTDLPSGQEFSLAPEGAGRVEFKSLRQWGSPGGVFVTYLDSRQSRVTLLVHPWAEEEPEAFNRMEIDGRVYWATRHKGYGVASWKSPDDKLVISVVADRSKADVLKIAEAMRKSLDAQIRVARTALK